MNPQYTATSPQYGFANHSPGQIIPGAGHSPQVGFPPQMPPQNFSSPRLPMQQQPNLGMPGNISSSGGKAGVPMQGPPLMPPGHHVQSDMYHNGQRVPPLSAGQFGPPGKNSPNMPGAPVGPTQHMAGSHLPHTPPIRQLAGLNLCQQQVHMSPTSGSPSMPPMKAPPMTGQQMGAPSDTPLMPPMKMPGYAGPCDSPSMPPMRAGYPSSTVDAPAIPPMRPTAMPNTMLLGTSGDTSNMASVNGHPQYVNGSPQQTAGQMMAPPMMSMTSPQQHSAPPFMGHVQPGMPPMPPKPGYPPQPSRQEQYPGQHMQQPAYPSAQQQQQQSRRLDPEQMPSPIQVMQEDQRLRSVPFVTSQRGQVPPLVTTNFITQDDGNASPRFIRASMYSVPATIDMMKQTAVPFGLVISPLAATLPGEQPPPIVDMGELGPVRCIRCKAYMCPLMQFIDGGRRFHCLLCKATSDVPPEYFQHLDHTGQRVDKYQRPELFLGAYEFVATKDYCRNNTFPKPPALIFLIDVSYNNMKSGMVNLLCHEMLNILRNLPRDEGQAKSSMRVGFITYSNTVHFYNIKGSLAQPKMMVVGDTNDMFMPLLDGFLCEPSESEEMIESLMQQIPAMFAETRETETILAPAIQAGLEALKACECAGKLLVFHSSLPIAEAPGKLKNRDDRKLLGTDKEKTVLSPQNTFYNNLGQDCVAAGCSVDLFVFNNSYVDLATISQVSRLTGGQLYKYTYFQAESDGHRLIADITRNISRNIAFDAIMRVRTSTGVRPTEFFGHFFMSNTTDMELASIDSDKAVAVEVKHDDKLTEEEGVFIQVALLYTSCGGQRRLRVLNLALKTCLNLADLYRGCDLDTIINFFAKQSMVRLLDSSPKPVKDALITRCAQMLACYRKNCASPSSAGQLILPECMKLLPLYVNCILKSDALSGAGSDLTLDDRSFTMSVVTTMDIPSSVVYFYPRLLPLQDLEPGSEELPAAIRCSSDKLRDDGVYLLENGIHMFLWVGANVSLDWSHNVFGDHIVAKIDIDRNSLPNFDNPVSQRLRQVIEMVRSQRQYSMKLTIIPQRDKLEVVFKHFLVEDRGMDGSASYVDFLCHMHKEIRNLLS